jgi:DNA primase
MDLLSLYQNGIKNVVASAGTALTLDQVNILNRITENINLIFDGDEAGQKAAIRAIELLLQTTTDFKIVSLPENEDPDSFIRKFGPAEFQSLVKSGKTYIDFVYDLASKHNSLNDFQNKLRVINSLLEYTAKVKDSLRREILAREIAKKFNVTESSVLQTLNKYVKDFEKFEVRQSEFERVSQTEKNLKATLTELHPVERGLIKLICDVEHIYLEPIFSNVEEEDFINPAAAEIFKTLKRHYFNLMSGEKINVQFIINDLEKDELKNVFSDILIERYEVSEGWTNGDDIPAKKIEPNKLMTDYIKKLKDLSLTKKINELQERLKTTNDLDESKNLLAEIEKLLSRKKDYQNLQIKIPD